MWYGAAAVCVNEMGQVLMVLQGAPEEPKRWALPSGGRESGETDEACCVREVAEETGYQAAVQKKLFTKQSRDGDVDVQVEYYEVALLCGNAVIQDPDGLIHDIQWKSADEIRELELSFPEDRAFLLRYLDSRAKRRVAERWFSEYFTQGNVDVIDELTTEDFVYHGTNGDSTREKLKDFMGWYRSVWADDVWTLEDFIESDDKLVVRYTGWMTFKGGWFNIPARDQRVKETGIIIYRFEDGRVKEMWCEMSDANILYQLDALPKNTHEVY